MTTRTTHIHGSIIDRSVAAGAVVLLAAGLALAAIAGVAPDGGQNVSAADQTPTIEDWRGNSARITPVR